MPDLIWIKQCSLILEDYVEQRCIDSAKQEIGEVKYAIYCYAQMISLSLAQHFLLHLQVIYLQ